MATTPLLSNAILSLICLVSMGLVGCNGNHPAATENNRPSTAQPAASENVVSLFFTAEVRGQVEPCGCTTDPLGDIARYGQLLIGESAQKAVFAFDGGSTFFDEPEPLDRQTGVFLRAELLSKFVAQHAKGIGFGRHDLAYGWDKFYQPRHVANLKDEKLAKNWIAEPTLLTSPKTSLKIGVFGVVGKEVASGLALTIDDPITVAKQQTAALREKGADLIVVLAGMNKADAKALALAVPDLDVVLVGAQAPEPGALPRSPTLVGKTIFAEPANRGQVATRIDITVRPGTTMTDAFGTARAEEFLATSEKTIAELETALANWRKDKTSDPAFLSQKQSEIDEIKNKVQAISKSPLQIPAQGSYFVFEQVKIRKGLDCNPDLVAEKRALDKALGEANVKAAQAHKPPDPPAGTAKYVGEETCANCHDEAAEFWTTTRHAQAWETLEGMGKQFDFECTGCHVTGWEKPGGSNMGYNEKLRDVQCETCHGPGSLHIKSGGKVKLVKTPDKNVCLGCHTKDHSDTFEFEPYLRDVTGKGHGEAFRQKLGDGPTGHELRAAGLAKAGTALGKGCSK